MSERRIVMFNQVSADGYFSDAEGSVDWVVSDPQIHERAVAGMPNTDTILFGRRTYQQFESFWPHALSSGASVHGSHPASPAMRSMAQWINGSRKVVVTRSLTRVSWQHSEIMPDLSLQSVRALKQHPGKDMIIFGSGSLVSQLTELSLIDEYRFVISPVLLGAGRSLIADVARRTRLVLRDHAALPSGNVLLTYGRA